MIRKLMYEIDDEFAGRQVLSFLKARGFSSRMIKELKKNPHGIMIGNKKSTVLKQLRCGDRLTVYIREPVLERVAPAELPLDIVYEDRDVVICNKPPFMATHPSQNNFDNTLANALTFHFLQNGEDCAVRPVNRLDKNTSGLILVAKNAHASGVLSSDLRKKRIKRQYLAFVEGCPKATCDFGVVDAPIARENGSVIKRCVDFVNGVPAVTHFEIVRSGEYSLLRLWLETGRTHQIRVHMSYIGCPVAGDFLYGHEFSGGMKRHALHSQSLDFIHPISGEHLHFEVDMPQDMRNLFEKQWGECK
jgi:23S rRNA pseudouridine1911/1915/1917 synthase